MKKLLLPTLLLLAACDRTPRTVIVEDNPKYCWDCIEVRTSTSGDGSIKSSTAKDTTICDKTGFGIDSVMAKKETGQVTIGNFTMTNVREVRDCKKR